MDDKKQKTVRVRIAVIMTPGGTWDCAGWGTGSGYGNEVAVVELAQRGLWERDIDCSTAAVRWIEADLPVSDAVIVGKEVN